MSIFSVNPDILDSQAGKLDQVAGDLESVSYPTGLALGRSTSSATTAISRLSSKASGAVLQARSVASAMRVAAASFRSTDESVASSTPGGSHGQS